MSQNFIIQDKVGQTWPIRSQDEIPLASESIGLVDEYCDLLVTFRAASVGRLVPRKERASREKHGNVKAIC